MSKVTLLQNLGIDEFLMVQIVLETWLHKDKGLQCLTASGGSWKLFHHHNMAETPVLFRSSKHNTNVIGLHILEFAYLSFCSSPFVFLISAWLSGSKLACGFLSNTVTKTEQMID